MGLGFSYSSNGCTVMVALFTSIAGYDVKSSFLMILPYVMWINAFFLTTREFHSLTLFDLGMEMDLRPRLGPWIQIRFRGCGF